MPDQVTNYQCPACTGPLHFVGETGRLQCDYCGSSYSVEEIEALYREKEQAAEAAYEQAEARSEEEKAWDVAAAGGDWGEDAEKMRAYSCPSCGAQLICDDTTAAASCPYCGNPTVVPGQFGGTLKPDYVLPFRLSKEDAVKKLKNHYKGKLLLPKAFTKGNHIEEIKGVYVPFWLFDAQAGAEGRYEGRRSRRYRSGDYLITETEHYDVYRKVKMDFARVPVDGSEKMPNDYMDSIEPYDYSDLKPFSTAYLPGFLADKYDVDAREASRRADERCENSVRDGIHGTISLYESASTLEEAVQLHRGQVKYALMPVWLLSTRWKDRNYLFAMNGQTGKMVGDLPADKKKTWLWFGGVAAGCALLFSLLFSGALGRMFSQWLL